MPGQLPEEGVTLSGVVLLQALVNLGDVFAKRLEGRYDQPVLESLRHEDDVLAQDGLERGGVELEALERSGMRERAKDFYHV